MRGVFRLAALWTLCVLFPAAAFAATPAAVVFARLAPWEVAPDNKQADREEIWRDGWQDAWLAEHERARLHLEKTGIPTACLTFSPDEAEAGLIRAARAGAELVVVLSPELLDAAVAAAEAVPKTVFFVRSDKKAPDFLSTFTARTREGWYLAGRDAARRDGGIGWLAVTDEAGRLSPDQADALDAFVLGVRSVRPQGEVTLLRAPAARLRDETAASAALTRLAARIAETSGLPALIVAPPFVAERHGQAADDIFFFLPGPTCDWTKVYGSLLVQIRFGLWRNRALSYGMSEGVVRFDALDSADPEALALARGAKNRVPAPLSTTTSPAQDRETLQSVPGLRDMEMEDE